jgi:hypothetical protein
VGSNQEATSSSTSWPSTFSNRAAPGDQVRPRRERGPGHGGGILDLADLEGVHTQFQNLFTVLGKYDIQAGSNDRISMRVFYTKNQTDGFTGGRGQNQIQADFGNTENFENSGWNGVLTWNKALASGKGSNEIKVAYYDNKRPRNPNSTIPEIVIADTGTFGRRFFLPITGNSRSSRSRRTSSTRSGTTT